MVSSALSKRRGPLRRPKVCKASPNPGRCHPPPPPVLWPLKCFSFYFEFGYNWETGPVIEDWTRPACNLPGLPWWWRIDDPVVPILVEFIVNEALHNVSIDIRGFSTNAGNYQVVKTDMPLVWGTQTPYVITTWDYMSPMLTSAKAVFLF